MSLYVSMFGQFLNMSRSLSTGVVTMQELPTDTPLPISYTITQLDMSAVPTARILFTLSESASGRTQGYDMTFPSQAVTQAVISTQSQPEQFAQVTKNFLVLIEAQLEDFAVQVRNKLAEIEITAALTGKTGTVSMQSVGDETLPFDPEVIQCFLDDLVRHWRIYKADAEARKRESMVDPRLPEYQDAQYDSNMASHYVDAYQSLRSAMFGGVLPIEE